MPVQPLPFKNRAAWREWLGGITAPSTEAWIMFYKRHTGIPSVTYDESVEEAICFGWIDGVLKRVDEDRYMQKFTPPKETSTWSRTNIQRAERIIAEGRMAEAGLRKYQERSMIRPVREQIEGTDLALSASLLRVLQSDAQAWESWLTCSREVSVWGSNRESTH